MEQDLKQKIETRFAELPEDVQKAITSAEVDKKIRDVATKHQLHVDQSGALGDEVLMAMMGFTDTADLADNIAKQINVPAEKAEAIAQDIGTTLFIPIRESMQEFMEQRALQETLISQKKDVRAEQPKPSITPLSSPKPPITPPIAPKVIEPHPADMMLMQKTVTVAPPPAPKPSVSPASPAPAGAPPAVSNPAPNAAPAKPAPPQPKPYATDPYREQPE